MRSITLRAFLLFLLLAGGFSPAAWAHARVLRTEPAKDTEVHPAPTQIHFWFNELLEDGFNFVSVFPAEELTARKRRDFTVEKPRVNSSDRTKMTVQLAPLPPGEYVVEWRVLSRDGHSAPGRFNFRVGAR